MMLPPETDPRELAGKRALVNGGSEGIGRAIAQRLSDAGATVVAAARRTPAKTSATMFVGADLSSAAGVNRVVSQVQERLGGVDIIVSNVGGASAPAGGFAVRCRMSAGTLEFHSMISTAISDLDRGAEPYLIFGVRTSDERGLQQILEDWEFTRTGNRSILGQLSRPGFLGELIERIDAMRAECGRSSTRLTNVEIDRRVNRHIRFARRACASR